MTSPLLLRLQSKAYSYTGVENVLEELDLSLARGTKVALTGPNGAGKSTLLKLLAGRLDDSTAEIAAGGEIAFVDQHPAIALSGRSGGEARRERLAEAFASGAEILLLDEPTNDLDAEAKAEFLARLGLAAEAAILVSHDPDVLDAVDEIWELNRGSIIRHPPGFSAYLERLEDEEDLLRTRIGHLESEERKGTLRARMLFERQEKRASRGRKAGARENLPKIVRGAKKRQAEKTLAKVSRAQDRIGEALREELRETKTRLRRMTSFAWDALSARPPNGKRMVRLAGFRLRGSDRPPIDFEFSGPKRIHLRGRNGSGKSTLLHALAGEEKALARIEGEAYAAHPLQVFDQRLGQFAGSEPLWRWFRERIGKDVAAARTILGTLGFEQAEQERPISALSGGERIRMELAVALNQAEIPQLLLLDEPTNHLDPESRRVLDRFVAEFGGAMVLVSHDRRFVESIPFDGILDLDAYR